MEILDKIPYSSLIIVAIFLGIAPIHPMPHLVEKLLILKNGTLVKPIDIFDLVMHIAPIVLLVIKLAWDFAIKKG
jgi:hypothetical protein